MKRFFILCSILSCSVFSNLSAQSDQSEKVSSRFLQLPNYDLNSVDLGSISVEYAIGSTSFGKERLKDTKSTCMPKGGGLKDVIEVTTYYYEVPFYKPATYMVAKDGDGKVVYAEKVTAENEAVANFGFDECANWNAEAMKKEWGSRANKWKSDETVKEFAEIRASVDNAVRTNIFPSFVNEEFKVYAAKGKAFDYTELDKAQEMAMSAYDGFRESGPSAEGFEQLNTAIAVWEKELETLDLDDKKARINKSIAKGLYENLTNAYLYTYAVDKGIKAGVAGRKLYGNMSNDRSNALDARIAALRTHQLGVNQNAAVAADATKLNALGMNAGKGDYSVTQAPDADFSRLEGDTEGFQYTQVKEKMDAGEAMHAESVASGEVNPYERYITETATQGKMLVFPPMILSQELTEFPKEMCQLTDVVQVTITNNKIASIPAEIKQMSQLKKLKLNGNMLTTIPVEISELQSLESLNLSNNPLTELPEEIQYCKALKKVTIKDTKLSSDQLKQLEKWLPNAKIKY